jgi:uncharacterized protein (DUF2236 family)
LVADIVDLHLAGGVMRESGITVGIADLERCLEFVRTQAADEGTGVFGPASQVWQVDREAIVFLGAGRALLMQLAHPWVATAIAQHSSVLEDPLRRFHRTFEIVFTLVFGSLSQALAASRRLHRRHSAITGVMPINLGAYAEGSPYQANTSAALMWVHATLVDTALRVYELVLPPLEAEARERYYAECRLLGSLFGIPTDEQPINWTEFSSYIAEEVASERLAVGRAAREIGSTVVSGAGRFPVPHWYRDVTAALLPEGLREQFQLQYGARERRRASRALSIIRFAYPALPTRVRHVAPYQEALARLSGHKPDFMTRVLNRLWIGRASLLE